MIMKRLISIAALLVWCSMPALAVKVSEVSLRQGIQGGIIRIVVESDEDLLKSANTQVSPTAVTVDFRAPFELKVQKDFIFAVTKKDRSVLINLKDVADIKVYRLSSPARIVIDMKSAPKQQGETQQKSVQKAPDSRVQAVQKPPEASPQVSPGSPVESTRREGQKTTSPPPSEKPRKRVIVIDPGHGGYDFGLMMQDAREKDVDLILAKDLGNALSKKGMSVFLTRRVDQNASLTDRINYSKGKNPDVFLSLHASSSDKFVIYVASPEEANIDAGVKRYNLLSSQSGHIDESRGMARLLAQSLHADFGTDVLSRELPLPVLSAMNGVAVLIEYPAFQQYNIDPKLREKFLASVVKGISVYEK